MRLSFSKLLVKRVVKYLPIKEKHTRKISRELNEGVFNDVDAIFSDFLYESICCWYSFWYSTSRGNSNEYQQDMLL